MFYNFLCSLTRSKYLSFFSFSLIFNRWSAATAKYAILDALILKHFAGSNSDVRLFVEYRQTNSDHLLFLLDEPTRTQHTDQRDKYSQDYWE